MILYFFYVCEKRGGGNRYSTLSIMVPWSRRNDRLQFFISRCFIGEKVPAHKHCITFTLHPPPRKIYLQQKVLHINSPTYYSLFFMKSMDIERIQFNCFRLHECSQIYLIVSHLILFSNHSFKIYRNEL